MTTGPDGGRPALAARMRALHDDEALAAAAIDALHAELEAACAALAAPADGGPPLRVVRWAYQSRVWLRGREIVTATYSAQPDADAPAVIARCELASEDGGRRAALTLVRTVPSTAEWRLSARPVDLRALALDLLQWHVEDRGAPGPA